MRCGALVGKFSTGVKSEVTHRYPQPSKYRRHRLPQIRTSPIVTAHSASSAHLLYTHGWPDLWLCLVITQPDIIPMVQDPGISCAYPTVIIPRCQPFVLDVQVLFSSLRFDVSIPPTRPTATAIVGPRYSHMQSRYACVLRAPYIQGNGPCPELLDLVSEQESHYRTGAGQPMGSLLVGPRTKDSPSSTQVCESTPAEP